MTRLNSKQASADADFGAFLAVVAHVNKTRSWIELKTVHDAMSLYDTTSTEEFPTTFDCNVCKWMRLLECRANDVLRSAEMMGQEDSFHYVEELFPPSAANLDFTKSETTTLLRKYFDFLAKFNDSNPMTLKDVNNLCKETESITPIVCLHLGTLAVKFGSLWAETIQRARWYEFYDIFKSDTTDDICVDLNALIPQLNKLIATYLMEQFGKCVDNSHCLYAPAHWDDVEIDTKSEDDSTFLPVKLSIDSIEGIENMKLVEKSFKCIEYNSIEKAGIFGFEIDTSAKILFKMTSVAEKEDLTKKLKISQEFGNCENNLVKIQDEKVIWSLEELSEFSKSGNYGIYCKVKFGEDGKTMKDCRVLVDRAVKLSNHREALKSVECETINCLSNNTEIVNYLNFLVGKFIRHFGAVTSFELYTLTMNRALRNLLKKSQEESRRVKKSQERQKPLSSSLIKARQWDVGSTDGSTDDTSVAIEMPGGEIYTATYSKYNKVQGQFGHKKTSLFTSNQTCLDDSKDKTLFEMGLLDETFTCKFAN